MMAFKERIRQKLKVLVAEDNFDLATMTMDCLKNEGFRTIYAKDGEEALRFIYKEMPDLILLDIRMPKLTGFDILKKIKTDILVNRIPIILLTEKATISDQISGLQSGADDYITKPYNVGELTIRIKKMLEKKFSNIEINPVTRLNSEMTTNNYIGNFIRNNTPFAALYIDINNFWAYNNCYGFERGDDVLKSVARILLESIEDMKYLKNFVGHPGEDDFIVVTFPENAETLCKRIIERFNNLLPSLYETDDLKKGYVMAKNRTGMMEKFNLISLSIGVATTLHKKFNTLDEVENIGHQMQEKAKKLKNSGSVYSIDYISKKSDTS